jgi:hypothetical protein
VGVAVLVWIWVGVRVGVTVRPGVRVDCGMVGVGVGVHLAVADGCKGAHPQSKEYRKPAERIPFRIDEFILLKIPTFVSGYSFG